MTPVFHNIGKPGEPVRMTIHHDPNGPADQLQDGEVIVATDSAPTTKMMVAADGKSLTAYVATLAENQQAKWIKVKGYVAWAQDGGCDTAHGRVQTDKTSLSAIHRAALACLLDPTHTATWTMMDNSQVTLCAADITAMSKAVQTRDQACHAKGQYYRGLIFAAKTQAALDAIDVRQDWPD